MEKYRHVKKNRLAATSDFLSRSVQAQREGVVGISQIIASDMLCH